MRLEKNIPAERDLPRSAARKAHLVDELADWSANARRRKRRRVLVLAPAVLALLAVTGFTTYALTREPTVFESVGCFERASLNSNVAVVANDGRDPAVICSEVMKAHDLPGAGEPRELASCVLDTGAIGVFPRAGATTCENLGLADLPPTYAVEGRRFGALRDALISQLGEPASGSTRGGPQCVGEDEALTIVRRELDAHGYTDWDVKVVAEGFTAEMPCADFSFDSAGKAVLLFGNGPR